MIFPPNFFISFKMFFAMCAGPGDDFFFFFFFGGGARKSLCLSINKLSIILQGVFFTGAPLKYKSLYNLWSQLTWDLVLNKFGGLQ